MVMFLFEIRTTLWDHNVERSLNTGITPLILRCSRGDALSLRLRSSEAWASPSGLPPKPLSSLELCTLRAIQPVRQDRLLLLK